MLNKVHMTTSVCSISARNCTLQNWFCWKFLYKIGQPRSGVANSWTGCWSWLSCTSFASPFPIGNCRWRRTTIVRGTIGMICGGHNGTRSRCSHRDTICPVYSPKLWLLDTLVCIQSNWSLDWNRRLAPSVSRCMSSREILKTLNYSKRLFITLTLFCL